MTYAFCIVMALLPSWVLFDISSRAISFQSQCHPLDGVQAWGICRLLGFACVTPLKALFLDDWVASSGLIVGSAVTAFGAAAIPEEFLSIKFCESVCRPTKILMNRWMESSMVQCLSWVCHD